jgi:hypothetical protein
LSRILNTRKQISENGFHENQARMKSSADATVCLALPVNVAEPTLMKQEDLLSCGSVNIGTISKRVF